MRRQKLAVVLIDYQTRFLDELYAGTRNRLIGASLELIEAARRTSTPVACLSYPENEYGPIEKPIADAISRVEKAQRFIKCSRSGFHENTVPNLEQVLRKGWGVNTLVLAGLHANQCVIETAMDAKEKKFRLKTAKQLIAEGNKLKQLDAIDSYELGKSAYECAVRILSRIGTVHDDHRILIKECFGQESIYEAAQRQVFEVAHGIGGVAAYAQVTLCGLAGQVQKVVSAPANLF